MDVFRIQAQLVRHGAPVPGQHFDLVAGLTSAGFIAQGPWYGVVLDEARHFPFMLSQNGQCQYEGDRTQLRHCNLVTRRVESGAVFDLTWEHAQDLYSYQILTVSRLNA